MNIDFVTVDIDEAEDQVLSVRCCEYGQPAVGSNVFQYYVLYIKLYRYIIYTYIISKYIKI